MKYCIQIITLIFVTTALLTPPLMAEEKDDLAKKLANPLAALISMPIQANYDENIGPADDGSVWKINIQPVIPVSINDEWNLISRTIIPIIDQDDVPSKGSGESGLGDILQSFFFSPKKPTNSDWIWGVGPALLMDTASNDALGGEKWGIGCLFGSICLCRKKPIKYFTTALRRAGRR